MSLINCRAKFQAGEIDKSNYIEEMSNLHFRLFEYANFIKQTDISVIEIQDNHLIMTLRDSGIKLRCETLDKRAAPIEILNFNSYEQVDATMIFRLLEPHMVFFDIGANIGWHSINVAKRDETIKVYAFEPILPTFTTLKNNIELNAVDNVTIFDLGFSNCNQTVTFYFDPLSSCSASARNISESISTEKVVANVIKLDDFMSHHELTKLDFIKCDVEGAELFVYQGGIGSIKQYQPIIFTEMLRKWSAKFDYHPNEIIQFLSQLGYRCFVAKNEKLAEFFVMDDHTTETNFFFLHADKHFLQIQHLTKKIT